MAEIIAKAERTIQLEYRVRVRTNWKTPLRKMDVSAIANTLSDWISLERGNHGANTQAPNIVMDHNPKAVGRASRTLRIMDDTLFFSIPKLIRMCQFYRTFELQTYALRYKPRQVPSPVCSLLRQSMLILLQMLFRTTAPADWQKRAA